MTTKTFDSEGRLSLGPRFANRTVVIKEEDGSIVIAEIPDDELWLYQNDSALKSVLQGLDEARRGGVAVHSPDIDAEWIDGLED